MATPVGIAVLQKGLTELYKFSKHSDCKIVCGSYIFDAHKAVICSQSVYFDTALKNGTFKEGETGIVKLAAVQDGADSSDVCDDPSYLIEHATLFAMAVKYQADGLRELAAAKFKTAVTTEGYWAHKDFPSAISIIYTSTPDDVFDLRQVVEDAFHRHFDTLKANEDMVAIIRGIEGLTYSLLDRRSMTACSQEQCI